MHLHNPGNGYGSFLHESLYILRKLIYGSLLGKLSPTVHLSMKQISRQHKRTVPGMMLCSNPTPCCIGQPCVVIAWCVLLSLHKERTGFPTLTYHNDVSHAKVIDPGEASIFSLIDYRSVVFYSVHSMNLPNRDFGAFPFSLCFRPTNLLSTLNISSYLLMSKTRYE